MAGEVGQLGEAGKAGELGDPGEAGQVLRLAVWSGPRNVSTALMRAWENRGDTLVVDEPLYAHYLDVTGIDHPGRAEVVRAGETDWRAVVAALLGPVPRGVGIYYQKHMAHHLLAGIDRSWVTQLTNVLLIRDPREVVASYVRSRRDVAVADIGLTQQVELYDQLMAAGTTPLVIDSADLLRDPEGYLRGWCDRLGVGFTDRMLSWPAGPRASDGVWGEHWYAAVWRSTGFEPYRPRDIRLSPEAAAVADACLPLYARLHAARWSL
ncbi:MAG: HAD family hydrolase [Acidimicrobiales bacterium]